MTLYFDYRVKIEDISSTTTAVEWHPQHPFLAIASYSIEQGGCVNICNDQGEIVPDVQPVCVPSCQALGLAWHPVRKTLVAGWEDGSLRVWNGERDFAAMSSPHTTPVLVLKWSKMGGRLVSVDASGLMVGWRLDSRCQLQSVYQLALPSIPCDAVFRVSRPGPDLSGLARRAVAGDQMALDMFSAWRPRTAGRHVSVHQDNLALYVATAQGIVLYVNETGKGQEVLQLPGRIEKLLYHDSEDGLIVVGLGLNLSYYSAESNGTLSEVTTVKLSGSGNVVVWAGNNTVACTVSDTTVRCWEPHTGETYVLSAQLPDVTVQTITSLAYSPMWAGNNTVACTVSDTTVRCWEPHTGETYVLSAQLPDVTVQTITSLAYSPSKVLNYQTSQYRQSPVWHTVPVKVSGSGNVVVWAGNNTVACTVSDTTVRCWEPHTGETYVLSAQLPDVTVQTITSLAYSPSKGVLCGCTTAGNIVFWRYSAGGWDPLSPAKVAGVAKLCAWGGGGTLLAVNTSANTYIMKEHNLCAAYHRGLSVVQVSASQLTVQSGSDTADLNTDLQVFGVCLSRDNAAVWSSKTVAVYVINPVSAINAMGSFNCEVESAVMYEQSLVTLSDAKLQVRTLQGTVKQTLDTEGQPITVSLTNHYLAVATISGYIHLWDVSRREAKLHGRAKDLADSISDFAEVICARANANGTRVALSVAGSNLLPLPQVYVWDMESDTILSHSFGPQDMEVSRFVVNLFWDWEEPRLLVCETRRPPGQTQVNNVLRKVANPLVSNNVLVSLIASSEHGLLLQDSRTTDQEFVSLLAVDTPNYIVLSKPTNQQNISVEKILMRDFEGLENCDAATRSAVIKFSFSLIIGDIDHAFKAIHNIHSVPVWTNLARMCVKARRLDVARVCLGNMKDARGVAALRQAEIHPEIQARVAMLAVHLGMLEEAERLYAECGRWDLLNKLLQTCGKWPDSVRLAEDKDRIHLRHTCHWYGKHLETEGDVEAAAEMYKRADTHRQQVPRMLLHDYTTLEKYIIKSSDPALIKWWAQYMESTGDMESAMKHYTEAGDHLSMVRVMCFLEDFDRAAEIANSSGDRAACYHLARQYENMGRIPEAIHFFTRATAFANAIRICKEQGLDQQLWTLAQGAGRREQLEVAGYLAPSAPDKAVQLYHRAGMLHRALDLAFRYEQVEAVQMIASELNSDSDSELLVMCAQFFIDKQHFEKAVRLLAIAKKYDEAIALCSEHAVILTEELADVLTPPTSTPGRAELLDLLAQCAAAQANYHLATKKYTQAGKKVKAMKALLKSGDTDKIVFFATVSRQQEIYVMAANYLQSLDWQAKPDLLKNIITFYTKGKAPHLLANFYMACAQVEVDEYGNYEKALGALNEASRCIAKDADQYSQVAEAVSNKIALVKKFLDVRRMFERGEGQAGLVQCQLLLNTTSDLVRTGDVWGLYTGCIVILIYRMFERGEGQAGLVQCQLLLNTTSDLVRTGDVYSLMIQHATKAGDWKSAAQWAHQLRSAQPLHNLALYVPRDILERLGLANQTQGKEEEEDGQEVEEEVIVDMT
ncbi:intraflagellar transport protein 140 homolog [Macrosteles quadrilineatus]|uniref:intraflagellar transport protein 140 homolog n=1 Tax=Macrosteles quadrilineatus TaxID=74068 RepID=UPI0023E23942|nr:intraflagellar transport protein 140 homolog [Macrosteles quadrilineatus]